MKRDVGRSESVADKESGRVGLIEPLPVQGSLAQRRPNRESGMVKCVQETGCGTPFNTPLVNMELKTSYNPTHTHILNISS